jgi:hypothetical protein
MIAHPMGRHRPVPRAAISGAMAPDHPRLMLPVARAEHLRRHRLAVLNNASLCRASRCREQAVPMGLQARKTCSPRYASRLVACTSWARPYAPVASQPTSRATQRLDPRPEQLGSGMESVAVAVEMRLGFRSSRRPSVAAFEGRGLRRRQTGEGASSSMVEGMPLAASQHHSNFALCLHQRPGRLAGDVPRIPQQEAARSGGLPDTECVAETCRAETTKRGGILRESGCPAT